VFLPWPPSTDPEAYRHESWSDRRPPRPPKPELPRIPARLVLAALLVAVVAGVVVAHLLGEPGLDGALVSAVIANWVVHAGWWWHVRDRRV
jgi:hypothetical protein